jgi:hypothetical protein
MPSLMVLFYHYYTWEDMIVRISIHFPFIA